MWAINPRCEVLKLDVSAHWRQAVAKKPLLGLAVLQPPPVFCDGYLHFLLLQLQGGTFGTSIVAFHIVDETLVSLTMPTAALDDPLGLTALHGCLCVFHCRRHPNDANSCCCIWRLACREAGRWEKLYCVMCPELDLPCWFSRLKSTA
jgi:hypothetical protein